MRKHEGCEHGPGVGWPLEPTRRWWSHCDTCDQFRPWADYFEVYSARPGGCWWWECERCLLKTVTAWGEKKAQEGEALQQHPYLTAEEYPALVEVWNNEEDTIYDDL